MLRVLQPKIPSGGEFTIEGDEGHHLGRVRRVRVGEPVEILDGCGSMALAKVLAVNRRTVVVEVLKVEHERIQLPPVHLHVGHPKGKVAEALLAKATELGVASINFIRTQNSNLGKVSPEGTNARWDTLLQEAVKQSGCRWKPRLEQTQSLEEVVANLSGRCFCGALQPDARSPWKIFRDLSFDPEPIHLFIGPEGDFSPEEYRTLAQAGVVFCNLGRHVLRVETAAVVLLGMVVQWREADRDSPE